jgi:hypothetical protein
MASWMVHFRIADKLLDCMNVNDKQFIVGNIGPDCGEPNEDWTMFYPSNNISHWKETVSKRDINSEGFYHTYLKNNIDDSKVSFYLGYYVHLMTDILWSIKVYSPLKQKFKESFEADENFIWIVKKDWYDLDHKYLKNNNEFRSFRIFDKITEFPNVYLNYFSDTAIEKRIKYISDFYNSDHDNLEREYLYLTEEQMNIFIEEATEEIKKDLSVKELLQ